jgi:hypothetical protein
LKTCAQNFSLHFLSCRKQVVGFAWLTIKAAALCCYRFNTRCTQNAFE